MQQRLFTPAEYPCGCQIIPKDILLRLSQDPQVPAASQRSLADTAAIDGQLRTLRRQAIALTRTLQATQPAGLAPALAAVPAVQVFDCNHLKTLPGSPVANPGGSADLSAKRAFDETQAVAAFFAQVFGRNSIDNAGMTLMSSVHFDRSYNNAMWNGLQMIYGDGDGAIFIDFTKSNDVIAHELTHGVTQHTLRLVYANEPGGLNESLSDVFGSMFRQWRANQTAQNADWLIGKEIMGPAALARGFTCLRDMAAPDATHCLAPGVKHFSQYTSGMDPHYSSGIPNLAFQKAATAIGGQSWARAGQIWYKAMTGYGPSPNLKMKAFADRTRAVASSQFPANLGAVDAAWKQVGL